jgi:hypothetical protein
MIATASEDVTFRDYLPTQTEEEQAEGIQLLGKFQTWYEMNIIPPAKNIYECPNIILVTPWSNGESDYRDKYRQSAQKFTGVDFFFYNLSPYAGAPELIVPGRSLDSVRVLEALILTKSSRPDILRLKTYALDRVVASWNWHY